MENGRTLRWDREDPDFVIINFSADALRRRRVYNLLHVPSDRANNGSDEIAPSPPPSPPPRLNSKVRRKNEKTEEKKSPQSAWFWRTNNPAQRPTAGKVITSSAPALQP